MPVACNFTLSIRRTQWKVDRSVFCQALAEGLKENSTLMNLDLWDNHIGDDGSQALVFGEDGEDGRALACTCAKDSGCTCV